MGENMAPPNKRRKLLSSAQDVLQQSEVATRPSGPQFFHGVEHIDASPSTRPAAVSPQRVEEVHLEIRNQQIANADDHILMLRRQGTAAISDIISTNSDADVVVAVTAEVDVFGSTTALTSATVTADLPDLPSLLSTSVSTATVSDGSSAAPTSSEASDSSSEPRSSAASPSTTDTPSRTNSQAYGTGPTNSSSRSSSVTEDQSEDDAPSNSVASSTQAGTAPARSSQPPPPSSSSQGTIVDPSPSANSSIPLSTSSASQSSLSSSNRLNLTTSGKPRNYNILHAYHTNSTQASTRTSGSSVFVSDFTIDLASVTSSSADSTSSIDFNALFLGTLSGGDVETFTRSDEEFTTTLSDGQRATVSPSSSRSSSHGSSTRESSGSVTTISDEHSTVRSTIFSTAEPSSTQSSSDDSNGVGIAGAADQGATETSGGIASTSTASSDDNDNDDTTAPPGTIAGGVVGGAAGLALVVLIILLFLRRYKKRAQIGHSALPASSAGVAPEPDAGPSSGGGPGMAERAGLMPFAGAVPAIFRNQSRSQNSGSGADAGERGFQRVSGRKLPSAFSEGMTAPPNPVSSPPPTMPLVSPEGNADRNLSSQSFYRDSTGFYGGDGSTTSPNPFSDTNVPTADDPAEKLTMSPGPQRRPTVHAPRSNVQNPSVATSGTPSWTPSSAAPFGRSETPVSLDGSRNSRFTEEV